MSLKQKTMKNIYYILTFIFFFPFLVFSQKEEYVDGRLVKTISKFDVEASTSLRAIQRSDGKYYTFDIFIKNNSPNNLLVKAKDIKAYVTKFGKKKDKRNEVKVFSNKEYQERKRKRGNFRAIMAAVGGGMAADQAGRSSSTTNTNVSGYSSTNTTGTGNINTYDAYGLQTGSATVDVNGQSNTYSNVNSTSTTNSYDGSASYAAQQNEERKLKEIQKAQQEAKSKWNEMYFKSETLEPEESVSGLINIEYEKGDEIELFLYVGNYEFLFNWSPDESEF